MFFCSTLLYCHSRFISQKRRYLVAPCPSAFEFRTGRNSINPVLATKLLPGLTFDDPAYNKVVLKRTQYKGVVQDG